MTLPVVLALPLIARSSSARRRGEILSDEMHDVVVTRVPHNWSPRRSRNFEERIWVRFPSLLRRQAALVFRLSPHSRLRRVLLRRAFLSGWASFQRRDLKLNFLAFAPECEFEFPPGLQTLGLDDSYRGHEGRMEALSKLLDVWGSELEPAYMLDLGDRLLNLGIWRTQARASGVPLEQELAQLVTVRDGLVIRDQNFLSWEEGLRAAGLNPEAIALPAPGRASKATSGATA